MMASVSDKTECAKKKQINDHLDRKFAEVWAIVITVYRDVEAKYSCSE